MDVKIIKYRGQDIRIDPEGNFNITDIAKALGFTRQQWYMERMKNEDKYENHLFQHRFDKRGPAATTIDFEGVQVYLDRTGENNPEADRLKRMLKAYSDNNTSPKDYQRLEYEDILSSVRDFLNKLNSIPTELAEEYIEVKKKVQSAL